MAHYNLQMIIAVGFKVNNERAVQFRKWANTIVKDSTIKGWAIDDERLKRRGGKSCVKSIKTNLLGENYGRNNFYQGGFST